MFGEDDSDDGHNITYHLLTQIAALSTAVIVIDVTESSLLLKDTTELYPYRLYWKFQYKSFDSSGVNMAGFALGFIAAMAARNLAIQI